MSGGHTGARSDPVAAREFRHAVVHLSEQELETHAHSDASVDAAHSLLRLSETASAFELRGLLTPDPADTDVSWTVSCFQVGDLTPIAVDEFADPFDALAAVADCSINERAAAELTACTAQGLRWTAISRTHDRVLFQLPTLDIVSDESPEPLDDTVVEALRRWQRRVANWTAHRDAGRGSDALATVSPLRPVDPLPVSPPASSHERVDTLKGRLRDLEESIKGLAMVVEFTLDRHDRRDRREGNSFDALGEDLAVTLDGLSASLAPLSDEVAQLSSMERKVHDEVAALRASLAALRREDVQPRD